MQRVIHENHVVTYVFNRLYHRSGVRAYVSTRHGGVSPDPWHSLNFSISRGDTPERVAQNRQLFANAVHVSTEHIVRCHQVHGTGVAKVDWSHASSLIDGTDGLITDSVALPLAWVFADCVPVLLYDPIQRALGGCHAGWRGTVNGAAAATLWAMQAAYGTDPAHVIACIGPSIGPESYQVGPEVVELAHAKLKRAERFFQYRDGSEANPYFDLWQANREQLVELGVNPANMEISEIDTAQQVDDFYSHRAEKGQCGLFAMIGWLE
ncbi:MAG: peptidoglycan editing factor PgeF [Chloroflexota bacterium]